VLHAKYVVGVCVVPKQAKKPLTDKQTRAEKPDRSRLRGLKQFDFEARIQEKIAGFEEDYDLTDMKFNDTETLRALCQSLIQLEDLEQVSFEIRNAGISLNNLTVLDKIAQQMSRTRLDMLKMQEDLKISRKVRQTDKNISAIAELDTLKAKAKAFYEQKMIYIFCPECNELLVTTWFLFNEAENIIRLECQRPLDTGDKCGHVFDVKSKDVYVAGSNKPELMPEAMR
jgi:hypothetical protein